MPSYDVRVLDQATGEPVGSNVEGVITVKLPLPPGNLTTL
jgi:propionyl-CoA synthetase